MLLNQFVILSCSMMKEKIKLLIFANVWPEPTSSAAGGRMLQLIKTFVENNVQVCYACTAAPSAFSVNLTELKINSIQIALNDDSIDKLLLTFNPNIVMFDRFMTEEQFGWRVAQLLPNTLRVLNTEDLHCVRRSRQQAIKIGVAWNDNLLLKHEDTKREIASIYRCDISLIISKVEIDLLKKCFKVPASHLFYYPFVAEAINKSNPYSQRNGFVSIGNMMHQPNWQSVLTLKNEVWPLIRMLKPNATLSIYGAYCTEKVMQLNSPKNGFLVKGRADDALSVIQNSRVLLAPLLFGAGLKGKLLEAMICGTPSVTTELGAEGMTDYLKNWGGEVTDNWQEFAEAAVKLHDDELIWEQASKKGICLFTEQFNDYSIINNLMLKLKETLLNLEKHRLQNFTGNMLLHHRLQSTKYMSKWITAKNKKE